MQGLLDLCRIIIMGKELPEGPRQFRFVQATQASPSEHSTESFEPTSEQLRWMARDAKDRTRRVCNAPLASKQAVDARKRQDLLHQYPSCTLRFRLPDERIVEAEFVSEETGDNLFTFVSSFCPQPVSLLYLGRPIEQNQTLLDQGLVPKAIIRVSNATIVTNSNNAHHQHHQ